MKILLATDGTSHSESAIKILRTFQLAEGDEIKVVSVADMAVPLSIDMYAGYLPSTTEIENNVRENCEKTLDKSVEEISDLVGNKKVYITKEILVGSPDSRIVETAEDFGADLIIVGSHGYNRWERLLLGSVSDSVVHHAPCSVLVVRTNEET